MAVRLPLTFKARVVDKEKKAVEDYLKKRRSLIQQLNRWCQDSACVSASSIIDWFARLTIFGWLLLWFLKQTASPLCFPAGCDMTKRHGDNA